MCRQREGTCRKHSGSAQTTVRKGGETCRLRTRGSGLTAIEKTLRGERMNCVQTAGGCMETTFRKCTDNGNEVDSDDKSVLSSAMRTDGRDVVASSVGHDPLLRA